MKTFLECKREAAKSLFGYDNFNMDDYSTRDFVEITDLAAKIYAESALDTAAEKAKIKAKRYDGIMTHREFISNTTIYSIEENSILSLKDQLK